MKIHLAVLLLLWTSACTSPKIVVDEPRSRISSRCYFQDVAQAAGVGFRHTWGANKMRNIIDSVGSGVGVFDYNNDGFLDIYLLQGAGKSSKLFRNNGDLTFSDVTKEAGVENFGIGLGIGAADYDNDGDTDLLVTNYGEPRLYRNNGNGTFTDIAKQAGLYGGPPFTAHAAFSDIDNDGFLDLLLINYVDYRPEKKVHAGALSKREGFHFFAGPLDYDPVEQNLYRNNRDGTFTEITKQAGIHKKGKGCAVAFSDFDGDGDQDFLIANDRYPKYLYKNDGKGNFEEIGLESGVAYDERGEATGGMAVGVDDFDGDGKPDAVITTMLYEQNPLFKNLGEMKFKDIADESGFSKDSYRSVAFGLAAIDIDNDGWRDMVITNGHVVDYIDSYSETITSKQVRQAYWNSGAGKFDLITDECGDLNVRKMGRGMAYGDLDNDGRMDLVTNDAGELASLYHNKTANHNHWFRVRLEGRKSNRDGNGAKVRIWVNGRVLYLEARAESGYMATNDPRPLFGLGTSNKVDKLEVRWPSGVEDVFTNLSVDQTFSVVEGASASKPFEHTK